MFRIIFGLSLLCAWSLTGCAYYNYTYLPSPVSSPGLEKRGDLKAEAAIGPRVGNAQLAYSPINHVGLLVQYSGGIGHDVNTGEAALGYYWKKNDYLLSVYAGVGSGTLVNKGEYKETLGYDRWKWDHNSSHQKVYGQISFGRDLWEICHVSLGLRVSHLTFDSYAYRYEHLRYELNEKGSNRRGNTMSHKEYDTMQITSPARVLLVDPVVSVAFFQKKRFSLTLQASTSFVKSYDELGKDHAVDVRGVAPGTTPGSTVSQAPRTNQPYFFPFTFSVGARFNLSTRTKKEQSL